MTDTASIRGAAKGINVIGHLSSSAGLGITARTFIDLFRAKGFEVAGFDVDLPQGQPIPDRSAATVRELDRLPHDRNLIVLSLHRLPKFWLRQGAGLLAPRFRNAGMLFWELPVIPRPWIPSLRLFDAVVACSHYVRQTFEAAIDDVPTVFAEHPLAPFAATDAGASRTQLRQAHGIGDDCVAFCCTFDPRSGIQRKNPVGAIAAWLKAFPTRPDVRLLVKSNGPPMHDDPAFGEILGHVARDSRIVWVQEHLSYGDMMALFASCDVFVSLHRAEGLGLVPMEAMSLGKLVIATGYSGNMTFMTEQNSMPVPYRLIEPRDGLHFLDRRFAGAQASWADPDLDQAARLMQRAVDDPARTERLARQAGRDLAARQATAWEGGFIDEMFGLLEHSTRQPLRDRLRRDVLLQEFICPTFLGRNVRAMVDRIARP